LQDGELGGEAEDGNPGSGRGGVEVGEELLTNVVLIFQGGIESVEEQKVDGSVDGLGSVVGEDARRKTGHRGEFCGVGGSESGVFFEVLDALRNVLFGECEVRRFEAMNGLLAFVGDNDVDDHELGAGSEGRDSGLGWLLGGGRLAGLRGLGYG